MAKMQVAEERGHGPKGQFARKAAKAKNELARVCPSVLLDASCGGKRSWPKGSLQERRPRPRTSWQGSVRLCFLRVHPAILYVVGVRSICVRARQMGNHDRLLQSQRKLLKAHSVNASKLESVLVKLVAYESAPKMILTLQTTQMFQVS